MNILAYLLEQLVNITETGLDPVLRGPLSEAAFSEGGIFSRCGCSSKSHPQ